MKNLKIKIITGFRNEQYYIIDGDEAHKAYYLFNNPEARTTFSNGVALIGKNIQGIEPAYNETMGWNTTHKLEDDDWNEIRTKGIDKKLRDVLSLAKEISVLAEGNSEILKKTLTENQGLLLNGGGYFLT
jgi:hypothetical protein